MPSETKHLPGEYVPWDEIWADDTNGYTTAEDMHERAGQLGVPYSIQTPDDEGSGLTRYLLATPMRKAAKELFLECEAGALVMERAADSLKKAGRWHEETTLRAQAMAQRAALAKASGEA